MKKILITGGAGYIGSCLSKILLANKYKVIIVDNLKTSNNEVIKKIKTKNLIFYKSSINEIKILKKIFEKEQVDFVVHLAAIVGDPACKIEPRLAIDSNFKSSKKFFNLCVKNKVKKFIFASTCSNYGKVNKNVLANEETKLKPLSLYAKLKVNYEKFLIQLN